MKTSEYPNNLDVYQEIDEVEYVKKKELNTKQWKHLTLTMIHNRYAEHHVIYTDSSKIGDSGFGFKLHQHV